jgi:iron(III) transport system substrate-binding protein
MTNAKARMTSRSKARFVIRASSFIRHPGFVILVSAAALWLLATSPGCSDPPAAPAQQVVLYTSVDEPYARPIVLEFTRRTGIAVVIRTDTEATKSVGLAARLEAERDDPRADVWWGNEVFHTIRLAEAGVLAPYASPAAADVPAKFKDPDGHWAGAGLRARVLAISEQSFGITAGGSLQQLLEPGYRGRVAIARPNAGTTGGHVAALYVLWGRERTVDFLKRLKANDVKLLGGNGPVAEAVARGDVRIGLTDNDDVAAVQRNGGTIRATLPDQDTIGTLAIPTTVALVAGAKNPEPAKRLIDYLLSAEVERNLIEADFAGWSVRDDGAPTTMATATSRPAAIRTMDVDYRAVARALPEAVQTATAILEGRE